MFLKALTLKGFKSFAETTKLEMQPGVTVVVGPNGSGKSNIVDAIGWVLGAQAPSSVRSSKMDDVIFAGTANKAALGRAEVSLTIDNSSGLLPIEFTEVTITRTLFRSGDSEYAINGVPCRLLDVQELLSDTGMGRQQHVIISQGQIDAVLNARPEDRRLIIEEAAGVLKFRRRKEKAERRLAATEANLTRLEDLRREVARDLRPLEKQADAARRHQGLADELRALRIHLSGRDLQRLRSLLTETAAQSTVAGRRESELLTSITRLDTEVLAAESALLAKGDDGLADMIGRCESLVEKARGQRALIAERRRRLEGELVAEMDREVLATLEAEAAQLRDEAAEIDAQVATLSTVRAEIDAAESDLEARKERYGDEWDGSDDAGPGVRAAQVRGELAGLEAARVRVSAELERIGERRRAAEVRMMRLDDERSATEAEAADLEVTSPALSAAAETAATSLEWAVDRAAAMADASRQADARAAAATARVETLESALAAARARAGVERLADLHGVVGTLLDLVEVDEAFQSAFEAGAGEAIAAVVVEGVPAARTALERLHDDGIDGAVLALEGAQGPLTGGSSPLERPVLRAGTVGLREHVRGLRPEIDRLLDLLVGHVLVADTWEVAVDALAAGAGALIVTRDGGRFSTTGWRAATHGAGTTGGALREARDDADAAAREAAAHHAAADDAITATDSAREDARRAGAAADEASRRLATLHATTQRLDTDLGELRAELESLVAAESELQQSLRDDAERTRDLVGTLPGLEAEEARAVEVARRREEVRADLAARAVAVAARRSELDARSAHLHQRQAALGNRLGEIDARLDRDERLRRDAQERHSERTHAVAVLRSVDDVITARLSGLATIAGDLQEQRRRRMDEIRGETENLERLRADRATVETELTGCRARKEELALAATEARVRAEQVVETLRAELDADPEAALHADCPDLAEGVTPVARVRDLDRELRRMGTINPLAIAEFTERKERHEFLATQIDDVRGSRRELNKVIAEVDAQIAGTFAAAFADVRANFVDLFTMLFPGGSGDLALTDPGDPLNTGIEIAARPSGKNVRTLSLLSGGERSLVALAFLFAVFRSRSSPFYVMDEVEAALDDVNLHRFLDLVAEFRSTAQLIIVSHQKRTMEAADALFGVTMQPGGASKVVSKRS